MVIKYSTTSVNNTIKINNIVFGINDVGYGPTVNTGFWNCITPPSSGYTIYTVSEGRPEPSIICPSSDNETIGFAKYFGGTNINTITDALAYIITLTGTTIVNMDYPNIVTSGLTVNLDAGFVPSYPRIGTTFYDLVGTNNGVISGSTFTNINSGVLSFANNSSYITLSGFTFGPNYYSVNWWWYPTSLIDWNQGIFAGSGNTGNFGWGFFGFHSGANGQFWAGTTATDGSGRIANSNPGSVALNTWQNWCVTFSNGLITVYKNSSPLASANILVSTSPYFNYIQVFSIPGNFSNISVYNRTLTLAEVQQNFNALKSRYGL